MNHKKLLLALVGAFGLVSLTFAQCNVSVNQIGQFDENNSTVTLVIQGGQAIQWVNTTTGSTFTGNSIQTSEPGTYQITASNYDTYNNPEPCTTSYTVAGAGQSGCQFTGGINFAWQSSHIVEHEGGYLLFEDLNGNQIYRKGNLLLDANGDLAAENYIDIITSIFGGTATMVYGSAGYFSVTMTGSAPIASMKFTNADKEVLATFPYSTVCDVCSVTINQYGEFSEYNNSVTLVAAGSGNLSHTWTNVETGATYTGWSITITEPGLYRLKTIDLSSGDVCGDFVDVAPYYHNPGMHFDGTQTVTIPLTTPIELPYTGYSTLELMINPDMVTGEESVAMAITFEYADGYRHQMSVNMNMDGDNTYFTISPVGDVSIPRGECSMISLPSSFDDIDWTSAPKYLNGANVGTYRGWIENPSPLTKITVGYNPDLTYGIGVPYAGFKGYIKELRIWSVSRSSAQVNATANVELTGTEEGLEGYWKFNERDGQQVMDFSSNANHGYRGLSPEEDAADPEITESCNVTDISVSPLDITYEAGQISVNAYPNPMGEYLYLTNTGDVLRDVRFNVVNVLTGVTDISILEYVFAPGEEIRIRTLYLTSGQYVLQILKGGAEVETINLVK